VCSHWLQLQSHPHTKCGVVEINPGRAILKVSRRNPQPPPKLKEGDEHLLETEADGNGLGM